MVISVRDQAILTSVAERLEELLLACKRGNPMSVHAPNLSQDVIRKAKALRTSFIGLAGAREGSPQPARMNTRKRPLLYRLYSQPVLYEMVRFVGYAGRSEIEFWDYYRQMAQRHTQEKASAAVDELFDIDKSTLPAIVRIKPQVLSICKGILGLEPGRELFQPSVGEKPVRGSKRQVESR
jgi:hypothetical protein